jgi:hypothetical protein
MSIVELARLRVLGKLTEDLTLSQQQPSNKEQKPTAGLRRLSAG